MNRHFDMVDHVVAALDDALSTLFGRPESQRPSPGAGHTRLEETQFKKHSGALMRVNHTGEVCAQALYQAQALTARSHSTRNAMRAAALEENDHLNWCEQRLQELDSHRSYLNPVWYGGSFAIGAVFGIAGDRWNLGFVAETERQVVRHLDSHLQALSEEDVKSRAIVEQMREDEASHASRAIKAGARELPRPIKRMMAMTAKVMTTVAARI